MQESLRQLSDMNEGAMVESSRTAARLAEAEEGWVSVGKETGSGTGSEVESVREK